MDYEKLRGLVQDVWMNIEKYTLPYSKRERLLFHSDDTDYVISPETPGMLGAVARLYIFFDEYVESEDPPTPPLDTLFIED